MSKLKTIYNDFGKYYFISEAFFFIFFSLIFLNPLAFIQNHLTTSGWVLSSLLAFVLCSVFIFKNTDFELPKFWKYKFGQSILIFFFLLLGLSFWHRATFFEEAWLQRWLFILLLIIFYQLFDELSVMIRVIQRPFIVFILCLCLESLYQYLFLCSKDSPLANSCFSSRFWNINMLAQALLAAIPLIDMIARENLKMNKRWVYFFCVSLECLMALLILLSTCRSATIGLFIFILIKSIEFKKKFFNKKYFLVIVLIASTFLLLNSYKNNLSDYLDSAKIRDIGYRAQMWKQSILLAVDNPMGLGVNKFEFGYVPYKKEINESNSPLEVDKTPHNEFLRYLTEEGWFGFFGYVFVIVLVGFYGVNFFITQYKKHDHLIADDSSKLFFTFSFCLLPELFFQFPTDMWFPTLIFALVSSCYLRSLRISCLRVKKIKLFLIILSVFVSSLFVFRNTEILSPRYSKQFCTVFHDNWRSCQKYFQHHISQLHFYEARMTLRPIIRWQPLNYAAIQDAYLLANPETQKKMACNYWNLYSQKYSIPESKVDQCTRVDNRHELIEYFKQISKQW